jgi:putative aminopeptidase FrvX
MCQPDLKTDALRLLRELTEAHGVSGAEDAVRR